MHFRFYPRFKIFTFRPCCVQSAVDDNVTKLRQRQFQQNGISKMHAYIQRFKYITSFLVVFNTRHVHKPIKTSFVHPFK